MTDYPLRWYLSTSTGVVLEITDRVNWPDIEVGTKANQDSWSGDLIVDDPDADIVPLMYRRIYAAFDSAPVGFTVLGNWFISDLEVERGTPRSTPTARKWHITMADENSLLDRRKFVGADADRPSETDIERIRWMLASTELNVLDPNEDFIDTSVPVTLDAADLHNQSPKDILASIMGRTGKQYGVMYREDLTPHVYTLWYFNQNSSTLYESTLSLSNLLSEVRASPLVYPLSNDTRLARAGGRMASGLLGPWKQKVEYVQDTDVGDAYAYVDQVAGDLQNVTTEASAIAQITRELAELSLPDDLITTTITISPENVNLIRAGMRIPVHATHLPNYTDDSDPDVPGYQQPGYANAFVWCRVMERTVRQVGPKKFVMSLSLSPQHILTSIAPNSYMCGSYSPDPATTPIQQVFWQASGGACGVEPIAGKVEFIGTEPALEGWRALVDITNFSLHAIARSVPGLTAPLSCFFRTLVDGVAVDEVEVVIGGSGTDYLILNTTIPLLSAGQEVTFQFESPPAPNLRRVSNIATEGPSYISGGLV